MATWPCAPKVIVPLQGTDSRTDDPSVVALAQQVAEIWAGFAAEVGVTLGPRAREGVKTWQCRISPTAMG